MYNRYLSTLHLIQKRTIRKKGTKPSDETASFYSGKLDEYIEKVKENVMYQLKLGKSLISVEQTVRKTVDLILSQNHHESALKFVIWIMDKQDDYEIMMIATEMMGQIGANMQNCYSENSSYTALGNTSVYNRGYNIHFIPCNFNVFSTSVVGAFT